MTPRHQGARKYAPGAVRGSPDPAPICPIGQHFGDNLHSDGKTPSEAGIKAIIYTGAQRTSVERYLVEQGWEELANLVRAVRLANPFPDTRPQERHLWLLTCQVNFPLLYFGSLALEQFVRERGSNQILFVSRDCCLWHPLFQRMFPETPSGLCAGLTTPHTSDRRSPFTSTYLYTSRKCLLKPSASYIDYFRSVWHPDSVIVDLFSTGASWSKFFERLGVKGRGFFLGHVDNYSYLPDSPRLGEWLDLTAVFRNSELGVPVNKGVEMLNYALHPVVEDVAMFLGNAAVPALAEEIEYEEALPKAAHRAFTQCMKAIDSASLTAMDNGGQFKTLVSDFVKLGCSDSILPAIYSRHEIWDQSYERRILESDG